MKCMIASIALVIPIPNDFQWFLIQKVNCEVEVVVVVGWIFCDVPAAIFFSTMPGQQSVVLILTSPA